MERGNPVGRAAELVTSSRPSVTIVGLGPAGPEYVTQQTIDAIARVPHRFVRTTRHPSAGLVPSATSFDDIYAEVPWLEIVPGPDSSRDALVAAFDAMPRDRRRAFKSHAAPPTLPYHAPGSGPDVRYVVVARNPDAARAETLKILDVVEEDIKEMSK